MYYANDFSRKMSIKEQGTKRILSPETINTNSQKEDKRRRNDSLEIVKFDLSQANMMDPEQPERPLTLLDIKKSMDIILSRLELTALADDIKNLVSKDDLKELDNQIVAQGHEMNQMKEEMKIMKQDLKTLQSNIDGRLASSLAGGERLVGRDLGRDPRTTTFNMAASARNNQRVSPTQRRNLVFEGLVGESEAEIVAKVIDIAAKIKVTVYSNEIEQVFRMNRRDESDKRPGPVLVTLTRVVLRDTILKKKGDLSDVNGCERIFINADEPLEIRKAKSFLRKAAYHARKQGEVVIFKHNQVSINGTIYTTDNFEEIPAKYLNPDCQQDHETKEQPMEASGGVDTTATKEGLIRKGERMKITKKGLCFSGPTAYVSNMAYIPIKFNSEDFVSNEQGYQWNKAVDHEDPELARDIKDTKNSYEVKSAGGLVTASPEWNRNAPHLLEKLFEAKLDQHPEILERLIETYPLELIEASIDTTWGEGGAL